MFRVHSNCFIFLALAFQYSIKDYICLGILGVYIYLYLSNKLQLTITVSNVTFFQSIPLSIVLLLLNLITSACNWKTVYFHVKLPNKKN